MVAVAQLVEPRIVIPVVVGSSPISHPKIKTKPASFKRRVLLFLLPVRLAWLWCAVSDGLRFQAGRLKQGTAVYLCLKPKSDADNRRIAVLPCFRYDLPLYFS